MAAETYRRDNPPRLSSDANTIEHAGRQDRVGGATMLGPPESGRTLCDCMTRPVWPRPWITLRLMMSQFILRVGRTVLQVPADGALAQVELSR
jgi:hypothetical protein